MTDVRRLEQLAIAWSVAERLGGWLWRWYTRRRFLGELDRLGVAAGELERTLERLRAEGKLP